MQYSKSPIDQLKNDQSSFMESTPYKQSEFNFQPPKIDHSYILESYKKLRNQQREQLANLRMPDDLKRKIFNFREEDPVKYQKPQLVIFNHPFRGKTVMTKKQVEKQLQRQRKNAQTAQEKQARGQKVQQNFLNQLGLQQEYIQVRKAQMMRQQQPQQNQRQKYPRKANYLPEKKINQIAEEINMREQQKRHANLYFIHKPKQKEENQKQRTQKMKPLMEQKRNQTKSSGLKERQTRQVRQFDRSKSKQIKSKVKPFKDMPVIEQEPRVVRDIKFNEIQFEQRRSRPKDTQNIIQNQRKQQNRYSHLGYGNQREGDRIGSGKSLLNKNMNQKDDLFDPNGNKSLSRISVIPSNNVDDEFSNSNSLNKALFMD